LRGIVSKTLGCLILLLSVLWTANAQSTKIDLNSQVRGILPPANVQPFTYTAVSFSSTPTFTLTGNTIFSMTLTGNVTSSSIVGGTPGSEIVVNLCQDSVGGRTFVWPASFLNPPTVSSTANACQGSTFYLNNSSQWILVAGTSNGCSVSGGAGALQKNNGLLGCSASSAIDNGSTFTVSEPVAIAGPRPYIDVTAPPYNASPTGTTDATAAIQAAISAACAIPVSGGNARPGIFFPPGYYVVSQPQTPSTSPVFNTCGDLYIYSNGSMGGGNPQFSAAPAGATIIVSPGASPNAAPVFLFQAQSNVTVENMVMDCYNECIWSYASTGMRFKNDSLAMSTTAYPDNTPLRISNGFWIWITGGTLQTPLGTQPTLELTGETPVGAEAPLVGLLSVKDVVTTGGSFEYIQKVVSTSQAGSWTFDNVTQENTAMADLTITESSPGLLTTAAFPSNILFRQVGQSDTSGGTSGHLVYINTQNAATRQISAIGSTGDIFVASVATVSGSPFFGDGSNTTTYVNQNGPLLGTQLLADVDPGFDLASKPFTPSSAGAGTNNCAGLFSDCNHGVAALRFFSNGESYSRMSLDASGGIQFGLGGSDQQGYTSGLFQNAANDLDIITARLPAPTNFSGTATTGGSLAAGTYYGILWATTGSCSASTQTSHTIAALPVTVSGANNAVNFTWTAPVAGPTSPLNYCLQVTTSQARSTDQRVQQAFTFSAPATSLLYTGQAQTGFGTGYFAFTNMVPVHRFTYNALGVNTTNPLFNLDVNGTGRFVGDLTTDIPTGCVESTSGLLGPLSCTTTINGTPCTMGGSCNPVNIGTAHNISAVLSCVDSSGSSTTYSCSTSPTFTPSAGDVILFKPGTTNTGASTLNVNSSGAIAIREWNTSTATVAGDVVANSFYLLKYDGAGVWRLTDSSNPPVESGTTQAGFSALAIYDANGHQVKQSAVNSEDSNGVIETSGLGSSFGAATGAFLPDISGVANKLVSLSGNGAIITPHGSSSAAVLGIMIVQNTLGYDFVGTSGYALCFFDAAPTVGHYVGVSGTTDGDCSDIGTSFPSSGRVVGIVTNGVSVGGRYQVFVFPQGVMGFTDFYQTMQDNGAAETQRPALNFIPGSNMTITCTDNSGSSRTDCTFTASSTAATAWSSLTPATNSTAGTFVSTGNSWDFSGSNSLKVPTAGLTFPGSSSGTVLLVAPAVSASNTLTLPTSSGTLAVTASAPLALDAATGNLTVSNATTSAVGVIQLAGDFGGTGTSPTVVSTHITGGTTNVIPRFNATGNLVNSAFTDNATIVSSTESVDVQSKAILSEIANAGVTGTAVNKLASLTGAPSAAVITTAASTSGAVGIVVGGAGTTGSAQIAVSGQASCVFDGATTAGHYVQISATVNGDCTDAGATYPTSGQVLGLVLSTNAAGGTYAVSLFGSGAFGFSGGGSGTVNNCTTAGAITYYATNGKAVSCVSSSAEAAGVINIGTTGSVLGQLTLAGATSGKVTIQPQSAAGTYNFNLPTSAGSANAPLLSGGGGSTAQTYSSILYPVSLTSGGVIYGASSTQLASSAVLPSGDFVLGGGAGAAPTATFSVVPPANGGTGVGSPTAHSLLVAEGASNMVLVTSPTTNGYYVCGFNVTASAAVDPTCSLQGIPITASPASPLTAAINANLITYSSTSPTAVTGPTLANNIAFGILNTNTGLVTYTPASGTVNGNATQIIPNNYLAFEYTDNTNTKMPVMPTIAAFPNCTTTALQFTSATGAFSCPASFPNSALQNSSITFNGTANQLSSPGSVALGGTVTYSIANPFVFPGKATGAASTTSAATFNIPSGSSPTVPVSGDFWNLSGILKFYDGTNTNSLVTIQAAPTSGHLAIFSGTNGLLADGGAVPVSAALLGSDGSGHLTAVTAGTNAVASLGISDTTVAVTGGTQGANTCSATSNVTMTGLTTSMIVLPGYSADPSTLTGWGSTGGMVFQIWPSASNTATWRVCNQTGSPITYSSITFNVGAR